MRRIVNLQDNALRAKRATSPRRYNKVQIGFNGVTQNRRRSSLGGRQDLSCGVCRQRHFHHQQAKTKKAQNTPDGAAQSRAGLAQVAAGRIAPSQSLEAACASPSFFSIPSPSPIPRCAVPMECGTIGWPRRCVWPAVGCLRPMPHSLECSPANGRESGSPPIAPSPRQPPIAAPC